MDVTRNLMGMFTIISTAVMIPPPMLHQSATQNQQLMLQKQLSIQFAYRSSSLKAAVVNGGHISLTNGIIKHNKEQL
jgi:hypothetical protein